MTASGTVYEQAHGFMIWLLLWLLLCLVLHGLFVWSRALWHKFRLPAPSIPQPQVSTYRRQVFQEICRRAHSAGASVNMTDYFADQGWNRGDAMSILAEPIKHRLIKVCGWSFGTYSVTRKGWNEYRKNFLWTGSGEVNISAGPGGILSANVNSPYGVAQAGHANSAAPHNVSHQQLINALRQDAVSADPDEAQRAHEYAEDLAEAVQATDVGRTDRILGRVNALLAGASSAFALTRELLGPGS